MEQLFVWSWGSSGWSAWPGLVMREEGGQVNVNDDLHHGLAGVAC